MRILAWVIVLGGIMPLMAQESPTAEVRKDLVLLRAWMRDTAALRDTTDFEHGHVFDLVFDWDDIARRALRENWINLSKSWQPRLVKAFRRRLITGLSGFAGAVDVSLANDRLRWGHETVTDTEARVAFDVLRRDEWLRVNVRLTMRSGEWKIYEIRTGDVRWIGSLLESYDAMISEGYHLEYVESLILQSGRVGVDDFSTPGERSFPRQWGWRKKDDDLVRQRLLFQTATEANNRYLAIRSSRHVVTLVKPVSLPVSDMKYLSWKWRIRSSDSTTMPPGRLAGIAVIFYQNWLGVPVTILYEWSGSVKPCAVIKDEGFFYDTYVRVLRSGLAGSGWQEERIDVLADYRRLFGGDPPEQIVGVYVVGSTEAVEADFDDIEFMRVSSYQSCPP